MKQLLEFIPLILFFVVYKFFGTQEAAITLVIATLVQLIALKMLYGKIEKCSFLWLVFVVVFGGLTAYFNDECLSKMESHSLKWIICISAV